MSNSSIERRRTGPSAPLFASWRAPALLTPSEPVASGPRALTWAGMAPLALAQAQTEAAQAWHSAVDHALVEDDASSREAHADRARRLEALGCVNDAIQRHAGDLASCAADAVISPRVVIAHRFDWFADRLAANLHENGLTVTSKLNDGAEALGVTIAEQPDLLILQDVMVRLSAETVLTEVRRFAPRTVIAVQVEGSDRAQVLHDIGAHAPFARTLPPAEVASCLVNLLAASRYCHFDAEGNDVDRR